MTSLYQLFAKLFDHFEHDVKRKRCHRPKLCDSIMGSCDTKEFNKRRRFDELENRPIASYEKLVRIAVHKYSDPKHDHYLRRIIDLIDQIYDQWEDADCLIAFLSEFATATPPKDPSLILPIKENSIYTVPLESILSTNAVLPLTSTQIYTDPESLLVNYHDVDVYRGDKSANDQLKDSTSESEIPVHNTGDWFNVLVRLDYARKALENPSGEFRRPFALQESDLSRNLTYLVLNIPNILVDETNQSINENYFLSRSVCPNTFGVFIEPFMEVRKLYATLMTNYFNNSRTKRFLTSCTNGGCSFLLF
ncbi:hypothetical protein ACOME3_000971 [Neoechinorhynchus agilis]